MPEPLEIRRLWYRARFEERGVRINDKPFIWWSDIKAFGVEQRVAAGLPYIGPMVGPFVRPCVHICAVGHDYPVAVPAVAVRRQLRTPPA